MNGSSIFDHFVDNHWGLAAAAIVVAIAWIVGTRCLGGRSFSRHFPRTAAIAEFILAPLAVLVIGSLARVLIRQSEVRTIEGEVRLATVFFVCFALAWTFARIAEVFILAKSRDATIASLPGIQRGLLYGVCIFLGLILFLSVEGYPITGLAFSTGAVAAVIGFAMQRTLGDLFSGIALSIERPFRLGDWVALTDNTEGQVIDMNWRATRLRAWDNSTFVIPNGELARQGFKNLHGPDHPFAPWYEIRIPAEVDPRLAKALLLEAALRCNKVLRNPLPVIRLADASTVPYTYMVWVHFPNYPAMFAGREELHREVHYALDRAGIQIAPEIHEIHARKAQIPKAEPPTVLLALKGLDIASSLTEEELERMASMSQLLIFDAGTILIQEGKIADAFDIIVNGIVESSVTLPDGGRKVVDRLSPGQYFGITSMITSEPSFLEFTSLTDVTVIRVNIDCVRSVLVDRPILAENFAAVIKQRLEAVERIKLASKKPVARLSFQDVLQRISRTLREPKQV